MDKFISCKLVFWLKRFFGTDYSRKLYLNPINLAENIKLTGEFLAGTIICMIKLNRLGNEVYRNVWKFYMKVLR